MLDINNIKINYSSTQSSTAINLMLCQFMELNSILISNAQFNSNKTGIIIDSSNDIKTSSVQFNNIIPYKAISSKYLTVKDCKVTDVASSATSYQVFDLSNVTFSLFDKISATTNAFVGSLPKMVKMEFSYSNVFSSFIGYSIGDVDTTTYNCFITNSQFSVDQYDTGSTKNYQNFYMSNVLMSVLSNTRLVINQGAGNYKTLSHIMQSVTVGISWNLASITKLFGGNTNLFNGYLRADYTNGDKQYSRTYKIKYSKLSGTGTLTLTSIAEEVYNGAVANDIVVSVSGDYLQVTNNTGVTIPVNILITNQLGL